MTILAHLPALEAALTAHHFPPMSPWWRETITNFYKTQKRTIVARVGRRGGKSSTVCRLAVLEALYGEHDVTPGDVGVVAIVSANRDQANERLRTIATILRTLKVRHRQTSDEIELLNRPIVFKTFAASVAGVVGFTAICCICDEVSKWKAHDSASNPAPEILSALRPTMATMPNARMFLISSPMGEEDAHATAFAKGDTDHQVVAFAPSWIANPTLTESYTRALAHDEREWRREFAAIPQESWIDGFFSQDMIERCIDFQREPTPDRPIPGTTGYVVACDPAFSSDGFGIAIAHAEPGQDGRLNIVCDYVHSLNGGRGATLSPSYAVDNVKVLRRAFPGGSAVFADQYSAEALKELFLARGMFLQTEPWTGPTKIERFSLMQTLMRDGRLRLPDCPFLRMEMSRIGWKMTASGNELIDSSGRDDRVFALCQAVYQAVRHAPLMSVDGSPVRPYRFRGPYRFEAPGAPSDPYGIIVGGKLYRS